MNWRGVYMKKLIKWKIDSIIKLFKQSNESLLTCWTH